MTPSTIALVISIITALFGAGLLPMFLKIAADNAVRADRQTRTEQEVKKHADELKLMDTAVQLIKQNVESMLSRLTKLDLIDTIAADVKHVRECLPTIMPRKEAESRIENVEHRIDDVERIVERRADLK